MLGNWLAAGDGMDLVAWLANGRSPDDIAAAWRRLAERAAPHVAIVPLPLDRGAPFVEAATVRHDRRTHAAGAHSRGLAHRQLQRAGARRNAATPPPPIMTPGAVEPDATAAASAAQPDDIVRFPRGAAAGECLHAIFERIDFGDSGGWPRSSPTRCAQFPHARAAADSARLAPMVERMLHDVVATPLPDGRHAGDGHARAAPRRARVPRFLRPRPTPRVCAMPLSPRATRCHAWRPAGSSAISTATSISVFEHAGRYYVLDWKSNHLGKTAAD